MLLDVRTGYFQTLCAGAIILRGSKIGNNVVIAAGTIVKGEIPDDSLVYQERNTLVKKIGESTL